MLGSLGDSKCLWVMLCKRQKLTKEFDVHGSMHCKRIFMCNQQNATLHNLFIFVKCSTCFRRFFSPTSGAQTVYIAPGTLSNLYCYLEEMELLSSISSTTLAGSSKGLTKYQMLYIQFELLMMGGRTACVEHFTEINRLCNVASCWLHLNISLWCTDLWTSNLYYNVVIIYGKCAHNI